MIEYSTKSLVLDEENINELDKLVYLYTEELGKVVARAKSARKITSKLAAYLEPLNFIRVRLVEKNGFQIVDALSFDKIAASQQNLAISQFIKEMTAELQPDKKLWRFIRQSAEKNFSYRPLLKILGFDPDFARCHICDSPSVVYFFKNDQIFFCQRCFLRGSKVPKDEIVLI
ncbi:MAG: DNA repair protein RecO [bacterium]|nr:DNA repair protein RecO [bacterium]